MTIKILGIETSCDETAVAIVDENKNILGQVLYSQIKDHSSYGGVVPEIAARSHLVHLDNLTNELLKNTGMSINELDAIAVTSGPGLIGGLITGVMYAKGLAFAANKPLIEVNHLQAHALTARLTDELNYPYLLLLVSGGHCQILFVENATTYQLLGSTIDDALGEAFDKLSKMLGLGYPGGPIIEQYAKDGNEKAFDLPKPLITEKNCNFSFSGLKTALSRLISSQESLTEQTKADFAASFQYVVNEILRNRLNNALKILKEKGLKVENFVVSGGVAANQYLRGKLDLFAKENNMKLFCPPIKLCTDNGVMIAWTGVELFKLGKSSDFNLEPKSRWPLSSL